MKFKSIILFMLLAIGLTAQAANTKRTVKQVTSAVTVTANWDYIVTSDTPFTTTGSVDLQNTEHAVLILSAIKPSKVISNWMGYIYIEGKRAVNGVNCQVRMYNRGAIIYPYSSKMSPLTCYTEQSYGGDSSDKYSEGHTGGYMNNLTDATLNNKIRSFKLKRGYMVTFAVGAGGWGYSRCFIADQADLEVKSLPKVLDRRISSYRVFKWNSAHKAGLASNGDYYANQALNTSWCYDWAQGNENNLPDTEWVPNHIYEDYPTSATCGSVTGSCHMKTNNEPANQSDDRPQSVETILANWENLMRTGMRLCSPSSWDGSDSWNGEGFIKTFLDSIDARGWRCDIVDVHAYWESTGQFNNLANYWYPKMKRPIWVSEWIWGSCWSGNEKGFWTKVSNADDTSEATQQILYNGTKPILDILNAAQCVERYAYWNSWSNGSKIYHNGQLTKLGEYYATMDDGIGYNASYEKIPNDPRISAIGALSLEGYTAAKQKVDIAWSDANGDLMDSIFVERKRYGTDEWVAVAQVAAKDKNSANATAYTYSDEGVEPGAYSYRIHAYPYNYTRSRKNDKYTNEVFVNVAPSQGTESFQYGKLVMDSPALQQIDYSPVFPTSAHGVFIGSITNENPTFNAGNVLTNTATARYFKYQMRPWKETDAKAFTQLVEVPFLALNTGNYKWGDIDCEVGEVQASTATDGNLFSGPNEVVFKQPFPEGVTPVVLTETSRSTSYSSATALTIRVYDVTNTGFKYDIYTEESTGQAMKLRQRINYLAITPGIATVDEEAGIQIAAGVSTANILYGDEAQECIFHINPAENDAMPNDTVRMLSPVLLTNMQTNNYPGIAMLKRNPSFITEEYDGQTWAVGVAISRKVQANQDKSTTAEAYRDQLGWVAISSAIRSSLSEDEDSDETSIANPFIGSGNGNVEIYTITGAKVTSSTPLTPGIYIIKANGRTTKRLIK